VLGVSVREKVSFLHEEPEHQTSRGLAAILRGAGLDRGAPGMALGMDRIADPWGRRTPYSGDGWPARTDMFLADGVARSDVDRWVRTASVLHSNGDAMDLAVADGRIVGVRGRARDRVNRGRLDPKDLYGWQANNSPDRLSRPLVRERGRLVPSDWDTACPESGRGSCSFRSTMDTGTTTPRGRMGTRPGPRTS
jgi:anaerobic selenocysteine-containing dehydrogenase